MIENSACTLCFNAYIADDSYSKLDSSQPLFPQLHPLHTCSCSHTINTGLSFTCSKTDIEDIF